MFLPHFNILCDLVLKRRTVTWNLFVLYSKELKVCNDDVSSASILYYIIELMRTNQNVYIVEMIYMSIYHTLYL